jgi:hypothetical protein
LQQAVQSQVNPVKKEKIVKIDWLVKVLLLVIAVATSAIALRPYLAPVAVQAQSDTNQFYIEPGTFMLRAPDGSKQVMGKVVVDLRNGDVLGFPTLSSDPYPSAGANSSRPVSHPFLLGRFAVEDVNQVEK